MNILVNPRAPSFGAWAQDYLRFRPTYPAAVFDLLASLAGPQKHLCVELGAGSGQATGDLIDKFQRVIAIEPDAAMAALLPLSAKLQVRLERAEQAVIAPASADAVVVASALHWMDEVAVLPRAASWLRPGGVFFAFGFGPPQYPTAPPALKALLSQWRRDQRAHEHSRLSGIRPYRQTLEDSCRFATVVACEMYVAHAWTAEALTGYLCSTSSAQARAQATADPAAETVLLGRAISAAARGLIQVRFPIEIAYGLIGPSSS